MKKVVQVFEDRREKNDIVSIVDHNTRFFANGTETNARALRLCISSHENIVT